MARSDARIALFSDVHGNWTALQEVWTALRAEGGFDAVVCAGDLACFRPHPEECVQFLREQGVLCVMGNTDLLLLGEGVPNPEAVARLPFIPEQLAWCRRRLSEEARTFLQGLPLTVRFPGAGGGGDLLVCHATPNDPGPVCPPNGSDADWEAVMGDFDAEALAFGHVHVPAVRAIRGRVYVNVAHCGLGLPGNVGYTVLTSTRRGWSAERHPVPHDPDAEREYAARIGFPGAGTDTGF